MSVNHQAASVRGVPPALGKRPQKSAGEAGWLRLERSSPTSKSDGTVVRLGSMLGRSKRSHEVERRQKQMQLGVSGSSEHAARQSVGSSLALRRGHLSTEEGIGPASTWASSNATVLYEGQKMALGINGNPAKSALNGTKVLLACTNPPFANLVALPFFVFPSFCCDPMRKAIPLHDHQRASEPTTECVAWWV